jgi:hypothetical protein
LVRAGKISGKRTFKTNDSAMNPIAHRLVGDGPEPNHGSRLPLAAPMTWFIADWRDMVLVHYRVPPEVLRPHVPHPLDLFDGSAWVSLVFFRLERMRPPGLGALGRALLRPISDHVFLNVRTYVRGEAGPGIHFLAEWIPNRLSHWVGPRIYGLPYRLGGFEHDLAGDENGVGRIAVADPALGIGLSLAFPARPARSRNSCSSGTPATPAMPVSGAISAWHMNRGNFTPWIGCAPT